MALQTKEISKELLERNKTQKRVYINLDNIDILFGENDTEPLSYHFILNLLRQKITLFFGKTQDFAQKEELAYNCIAKIYSSFKRRLVILEEEKKKDPNIKAELFFYISQFYCYVEHTARNEIILYRSKKRNNTLEYREGVDYTQPLENFIGHDVYDFEDFIVEQENDKETDKNNVIEENEQENQHEHEHDNEQENFSEDENDLEEEKIKNREKFIISQNILEKVHLEKEIEKKEEQMQIDFYFKKNKYFNEDEKRLIIGIYNNERKEDIFVDKAFEELLKNYNNNNLKIKKNVCYTLENISKKKFNEILYNLQLKIEFNPKIKNSLDLFIGGVLNERN